MPEQKSLNKNTIAIICRTTAKEKSRRKLDTRKTALDLFLGNGVELAMPFPRFVSQTKIPPAADTGQRPDPVQPFECQRNGGGGTCGSPLCHEGL